MTQPTHTRLIERLPERFEAVELLGSGGFGSVWAVEDRVRGARVALKVLSATEPRAIRSFKREFRGLTDIVHPNLVTLYELHAHEGLWFFTMELVPGVDFLTHVRDQRPVHNDVDTITFDAHIWRESEEEPPHPGFSSESLLGEVAEVVGHHLGDEATAPFMAQVVDFHEGRLRETLRQLFHGICALHDAGMLHRDLKPANVLVTPQGRVVLLDFGLISELSAATISEREAEEDSRDRRQRVTFIGTPHYMSPEQAMQEHVGPASDWYAFGAMLYEALAGRRPIEGGTPLQLLLKKQSCHPAYVLEFAPHAPQDLAQLAMDLLARHPHERPGRDAIAAVLDAQHTTASLHEATTSRMVHRAHDVFVGRQAQLVELRGSLEAMHLSGRAQLVNVTGPAGMGKSALMRTFLRDLAQDDPSVLIFEGRCLENESVPFKAFDHLADTMSRTLQALDEDIVAEVAVEVATLARLFPTFERVSAAQQWIERGEDRDPHRVRETAFEALRGLLHTLSAHYTIILFIDDAQWGDEESAALIEALLAPPDPPRLLFVIAYRAQDKARSPFLRPYLAMQERFAEALPSHELRLEEMTPDEAREMASSLLAGHPASEELLAEVVAEAKGHPLFLCEITRDIHPADRAVFGLDAVLIRRVEQLPGDARRMLDVVAVAGGPIALEVVRELAAPIVDAQASLMRLRADHLVRRTTEEARAEVLEPYHDRITETARALLTERAITRWHVRLAEALHARPAFEPAVVAEHYLRGGHPDAAKPLLREAAEIAIEKFAFERAERLLTRTLEIGEWPDAEALAMHERLGVVRGHLGKGVEAASSFHEARAFATGERARRFRRLAAEQLVRAGRLEQGRAILEGLLADLGVCVPSSRIETLTEAAALERRLWEHGALVVEDEGLDDARRERMEVCWSAARLLSAIDLHVGAYYGRLYLRDALAAGEPAALCRALALEAIHQASSTPGRYRVSELLDRAARWGQRAQEAGADDVGGFVTFARGITAYLEGQWRDALDALIDAESALSASTWEVEVAQFYQMVCKAMLGDWSVFTKDVPQRAVQTSHRGDVYYAAHWCLWNHWGALLHDHPERAEALLEDAITEWRDEQYDLKHLWGLFHSLDVALYAGDVRRPFTLFVNHQKGLEKSLLLHNEMVLIFFEEYRARSYIAALTQGASDARAARCADGLDHSLAVMRRCHGYPHAQLFARMIEAQRAYLRGERRDAMELLAASEEAAAELGETPRQMASMLWRGRLMGQARAAHEARWHAERWFAQHGVRNLDAMLAVFFPAAREPHGRT